MEESKVNLPLLGGCLCGAVRYSLNAAPLLVHACHCHDCQSVSGSAYSLPCWSPPQRWRSLAPWRHIREPQLAVVKSEMLRAPNAVPG
jgi:hypothetical protein